MNKQQLMQRKVFFRHNGKAFSMDNILSLINQASSKDRNDGRDSIDSVVTADFKKYCEAIEAESGLYRFHGAVGGRHAGDGGIF